MAGDNTRSTTNHLRDSNEQYAVRSLDDIVIFIFCTSVGYSTYSLEMQHYISSNHILEFKTFPSELAWKL